ncbi:hypothetical protein JMA_29540 [Jeotgalibacillus malaysiensis]|uniref:N-acetylglucosaminyldiphosphoundecaprenol N-acetyl-beta-D-mannosaminyltransferase n=1 Tax=Jeotgalibacillus malaysiensis TaxID=1508404 RepID=A0A0B5AQ93_9BACL|nr:WecB/TagA/CpsF family glycosyltransferase [Jeotgalibacillus malaysiensis]AJD92271.1 hypothetical protein JMA_29540 [Jeotgalibacillus malaysiensis]
MSSIETILDVEVTTLPPDKLLADINAKIKQKQKGRIVAINPEKIMMAQQDESLKQLLNSSAYKIPDGIGVSIASKLGGGQIRWRVTGVGMMESLLELADREQHKVFFYGAKEEVVKGAMENIQKQYPLLPIAGYCNGYEQDEQKIIDQINESGADIVFVALGSPRQELFIERNMDKLNASIYQGVGGSFDVFSGTVKRAPEAFQKIGMEWFYRLITNPSRIKRQMALPKFLLAAFSQRKKDSK